MTVTDRPGLPPRGGRVFQAVAVGALGVLTGGPSLRGR
jgi:hypothetical protein